MKKSEGILKTAIASLVIAVIFYIAGFTWIQHRREFKGPWVVGFASDPDGKPWISITQPTLNISEKLTFPDEHLDEPNMFHPIRFDQAIVNLPYGEMVFQDPTFLPGTVNFKVFGHEIEIFPRAFMVDRQEYQWQSNGVITVQKLIN